jgi:probable F420-dependent oxidoreductase
MRILHPGIRLGPDPRVPPSGARVQFGIIPGYQSAPVETPEFATGFARLVEAFGFESVWPVEHVVMPAEYGSRYPYSPDGRMPIPDAAIPDPLIWNTWIAAASSRLVLGTAMIILPQRNPVVLAKIAASLDVLSGGRTILGIGLGWMKEEADAVGTDFGARGKRADEYIAAMRALWTEPVASFHGETVNFDEVKCNPRPKRSIPIHVGGHSPAAARRAGRLGDGFLPIAAGPEDLAGLRKIVEKSAREAGRDPASIEISCLGLPDAASAQAYADAGVDRMIVASHDADLEGVKRTFGVFSERVMRAHASG